MYHKYALVGIPFLMGTCSAMHKSPLLRAQVPTLGKSQRFEKLPQVARRNPKKTDETGSDTALVQKIINQTLIIHFLAKRMYPAFFYDHDFSQLLRSIREEYEEVTRLSQYEQQYEEFIRTYLIEFDPVKLVKLMNAKLDEQDECMWLFSNTYGQNAADPERGSNVHLNQAVQGCESIFDLLRDRAELMRKEVNGLLEERQDMFSSTQREAQYRPYKSLEDKNFVSKHVQLSRCPMVFRLT